MTTQLQPQASRSVRLLYADTLRGTLMLLGVVYHVAGGFVADDRTPLPGQVGWVGWDLLREFTHLWRMPAFFTLAGFFAVLILSRRGVGPWFKRRLLRLGVPLVFGLLVVNSAVAVRRASVHGELEGLGWREVPGEVVLPELARLGHLWFLVHLLVLCAALAVGAWLIRGSGHRVRIGAWADRVAGSGWLLMALVVLLAPLGMLLTKGLQMLDLHQLTGAWLRPSIAVQAMSFALGALLGTSPRSLDRMADRAGPWVAALAVGSAAALMWVPRGEWVGDPVFMTLAGLCGLAWTVLLLALFRRFADVGGWFPRYVVDASLTVYVVHYAFVGLVRRWMFFTDLGPISGALVTLAIVSVFSFLVYELLNLHPWSRFVSTGQRRRGASVLDLLPSRRVVPA